MPHSEGVVTAKLVNFCPGTMELWIHENSIFLVPVKYTFVRRAPALAVLGHMPSFKLFLNVYSAMSLLV